MTTSGASPQFDPRRSAKASGGRPAGSRRSGGIRRPAAAARRPDGGADRTGWDSGRAPSAAPNPSTVGAGAGTPAAPTPSFAELGVAPEFVAAMAAHGVTVPFPIQAATLADSLAGRDVLGRGRTGSGKTMAFALPTVAALKSGRPAGTRRPRALVLVPTRELANQVAEAIAPLARAARLTVVTIYGGVGQQPQVSALRKGVDIVVACPGRLEDLIGQGHCRLDAVEVTVLDEADHMADLGFLPGVKRLLDATPAGGQRLLFSATLDNGVDVLVRRYLQNPAVHSVDDVDAPPPAMSHHVLHVTTDAKASVVRELASGHGRSLLFTRTKHGAKKLARALSAAGVPAVDLHGNLTQPARQRNLAAFSTGAVRVLVATDIAARGIHVDDISLVIHVDPPTEHKAYLHRSGRTARAGSTGDVVTVMTSDQEEHVRSLARKAGIRPAVASVRPGDDRIRALTGPAAPLVEAPAPPAARPAQPRPAGRERARRNVHRSGSPAPKARQGNSGGRRGR